MKQYLLSAATLSSVLIAAGVRAEEAGSGHYMPGATASFIDQLPGKPSIVGADLFTYYNGSVGGNQALKFGGETTLGAHATVYADTIVGLYQTPFELFGGSYAAGVGIPYVWMEVDGQVHHAGPFGQTQTVSVRDTASSVGDLMLFPFMLGWTNGPDFKYDTRLTIYAPTGPYDVGRLANTGRNYWTVEPAATVSWLSTKIGTEVTLFAGFDINTENPDTHYTSGASFHLDGTVAQHLPLFGGFAGVGANGFVYQQISGDSGSGATLGSFEGRTVGVGPVLSYAHKICDKIDLAAELKWLSELDVEKRLKGDYVWFKIGLVF